MFVFVSRGVPVVVDERVLFEWRAAFDACLFDALVVSGVPSAAVVLATDRVDGVCSMVRVDDIEDDADIGAPV